MEPFRVDHSIYQGSTFFKEFLWTAGSDREKRPVDFTDKKLRMQIRSKLKSENYIIELNTENGGIVLGCPPSNGEFLIYIDSNTTTSFSFKNAVYDLEMITENPNCDDIIVQRIMYGNIKLNQEITR